MRKNLTRKLTAGKLLQPKLLMPVVAAAIVAFELPVPTADAAVGDTWSQVANVESVAVRVHWVSDAELVAAARSHGKRPSTRPLGFSVLQRNTQTGEYFCDIYMPERLHRVEDRATASLGHEMAHCLGFSHET